MIKRLNSLALASSMLFICACTSTSDEIKEKNSPQLFRISDGIEVGMIAPAGFNITQEHYGFAQPESFSRIRIAEIETPYVNYIQNLTADKLLKRKLKLIDTQQITVGDALCTLIKLRQNVAGTYFEKLWLIAGDNLSSIQLEASYPEGASKNHKQAIKDSLLTLSVATEQNLRLYTGLPFKFSETPNFKLKQRFANSVVFLPIESNDTQSVVVSHGATKEPIEKIKTLSDHFLKKGKHYQNVEVLKNEMIKINKIPALATTAYAELKGKPVFIYQILSYQKEKFLLVQSQTDKTDKKVFKDNVDGLMQHFEFK